MARKAKYNKELKVEIIKRYLKGESASLLARQYGIGERRGEAIIREWVRKYNELGDEAFEETLTNKSYSKEFKEKVIQEYLEGKDSYEGLANKHNIPSKTIVINWVRKYNEGIEIKGYDPKGDVYTMKSRKTTFEERLEIVNYVLANDFDYKGAADKYSVPYASVYQWVKKYNELGENGLNDSRGRPSSSGPKKELTIEEKQAIEIEKLKRELEREKMVVEVLKKTWKSAKKWKEILAC